MTLQKANRYEELKECYDHHAAHFVETRKKKRPEMEYVRQVVQNIDRGKEEVSFVELGCGGGRLYTALSNVLPSQTHYTGVDFSAGMIQQAQKAAPKAQAPEATWIVDDMIDFVCKLSQESVTCFLGIASIQHIKGANNRAMFFSDAYRALERGGMMILTNWSYSERFFKKYWKNILSGSRFLITDPQRVRNDVLVPRKDHTQATEHYLRYYHLFTLYELQQLATHAGFVIRECTYVAQDGTLTEDWKKSRNSFLVVQKEVI